MLGDSGRNCDGCDYLPELGAALRYTLQLNPPDKIGMQPLAWKNMEDRIASWCSDHLPYKLDDRQCMNADVFHNESERAACCGETFFLLEELRQERDYVVVLVGPNTHHKLRDLWMQDGDEMIECPSSNAWFFRERIVEHVLGAIASSATSRKKIVVMLCCGMLANVLVGQLKCLLSRATVFRIRNIPEPAILDIGSLWEPYIGLCTRGYHYRIVNKVLR